ncbi:VCBS repeat-containing protein [Candidatus Dependentiae bacterium]|nr:VCBS repeat-containing protein [Candidatus Dependentiae bacterium]
MLKLINSIFFIMFAASFVYSGTFTNVQEPMGVNQGVNHSSISFGDYDNDGDLDLVVTGDDGTNKRFIIYRNDNGTFNYDQEPMGVNQGVYYSSVAFVDYDNDGDLDIVVIGDDGVDFRFIIFNNDNSTFTKVLEPVGDKCGFSYSSMVFGDIDNDGDLDLILIGTSYNKYSKSEKQRPNWPDAYSMIYRNDEISINSNPSIPTGLRMRYSNGKWHLKWRPSIDDHTSQQMLRYKIALGDTGPGDYRLISPVIDYPRGQVNIGNVNLNSECIYEIELPITKPLYWSVCAIDSCFKQSDFSEELYTYRISGYVTNYYTGKPGSGIRIKIKGSVNGSVFTNSEGYYEFYCVKDGNVTITPFKNNLQFSPESFTIDSLSSNERVNFTIYYHERLFNFHLYPNPCKLNKNKFINFRNCSEGTTIKIYNITGDLVFSTYTNAVNYKWDIKSNKGGTVSSGVYFYRVYNKKGEEKRGKLVIIK